ncbi:hypothetical protein VULLAG_LOCUS13274 [Vulpes lagopus]
MREICCEGDTDQFGDDFPKNKPRAEDLLIARRAALQERGRDKAEEARRPARSLQPLPGASPPTHPPEPRISFITFE